MICRMTPFMCGVQNRQIRGDRKQFSGCQGWGDGDMESDG